MRFIDRVGFGVATTAALLLGGCGTVQFRPGPAQPPPLSQPDWIRFPPPAAYPPDDVPSSALSSMRAYRLRAAARIHELNAKATFSGPLPEPLTSIPVLQIELNRDGSVKQIDVLRVPKFEPQTVEMAKAAVMRAAPFGFVGNLPQPWTFNETFLYNESLKFQLRSVVEGE